MRCLVDTSAYSAFQRSHERIIAYLSDAEEILLNPITIGELRSGFLAGDQLSKNEAELEEFLDEPNVTIMPIIEETGERYAVIKYYLRSKGTPIPDNDLWIAATAYEHSLSLVTTDRHFERIPQIALDLFEL